MAKGKGNEKGKVIRKEEKKEKEGRMKVRKEGIKDESAAANRQKILNNESKKGLAVSLFYCAKRLLNAIRKIKKK